jgi:hypothetical protein
VQDAHQPQQPPPQQPPPPPPPLLLWLDDDPLADRAPDPLDPTPVTATVRSSRTVSVCPLGQGAGSSRAVIERLISKVSPQERQRTSYRGMPTSCMTPRPNPAVIMQTSALNPHRDQAQTPP